MFLQLTARNRHFVTVGLPMIALLGAFGIAYPRYQALKADEVALAQTQREIAAKQSTLAVLQAQPQLPIVARVPATPDEPVEFLRNLNSVARSCGVRIETYTAGAAAPTPPPAPPASGGAAATGDTLPPGTTASTLEITAEGTYASMTRFFQRLETYPRLINVSQVSMQTKQYPLLTTKFRLSRYTGLSPESAAL